MTTRALVDPANIRKVGIEVLNESLGPIGMARFLQQFGTGSGNYTKDRDRWLKGLAVRSIVKEIKKQQKKEVKIKQVRRKSALMA